MVESLFPTLPEKVLLEGARPIRVTTLIVDNHENDKIPKQTTC